MIKPVLLLDVDGVIADCSTAVHQFAESLFERELPHPDDWTCWEHAEAMGLTPQETRLFEHSAQKSCFPYSIQLYPDAWEAVIGLKEHYTICFVTSRWFMNRHWVHARDMLLEPFGCEIIHTDPRFDKRQIAGDVFVDDKVENVLTGAHARFNILFERSYNKDAVVKHRIRELWELVGFAEKAKSSL